MSFALLCTLTLMGWLGMCGVAVSDESSGSGLFANLEAHIKRQVPDWWPQYQVVQAALQDQRLEDARLLLESLLKDQTKDESAFQLLGPRYLWLTPTPDCAVFEGLSKTPEPWLAGTQRFCRYLTERRQETGEATETSLYSWFRWLFGIKTRRAMLMEQTLTDLEAFQIQQPDSLILIGLTSALMHLSGAPHWRIDRFWQDWQAEHPDVIITPHQLLWDALSRHWLPATTSQQGSGSFLVPGAGADMTTKEMGEQAHWAYGRFTGKAASTISSAWRSLEAAITCFHRAQGNPQMFRFYLCLIPYDAARQNIGTLFDLLYVGDNPKRRAPWRDMWEWNAGDLEYVSLVYEFNLVAGLRNRVTAQLQEGLQQQVNQVSNIQDPEERIQANLNLLNNPLADIVPPEQKQEARSQLQANLGAIQNQKARNAAAQRFSGRQRVLLDQIKQSPLNELLWDQYLALLNSEDAIVSLSSDFRLGEIANAKQQRQWAKEQNYSRHLIEVFKQQEALIQTAMSGKCSSPQNMKMATEPDKAAFS